MARVGRPRDPALDTAILAAAGRLLGERGYDGMSLEAVAAAAGTTVPSLRRRYRDKAHLAAAVIGSLRVEVLPDDAPTPNSLVTPASHRSKPARAAPAATASTAAATAS